MIKKVRFLNNEIKLTFKKSNSENQEDDILLI